MIRVEEISSEQTKALRHKVLWPHIPFEKDCIFDIDKRKDAMHLGAFDEERIIGICSLFEMASPRLDHQKQYRLRAMATDTEWRGKQAGRAIIEKAVQRVRGLNMEVLWCDAREVSLGFYGKMGFKIIDEWYEVPKIGLHKTAYFEL